jgi:predicted Na+-dependent transporter
VKEKVSQYFGVILVLSGLIGFIVPSPGDVTSIIIPLLLAITIFASFFQLDFSKEALLDNAKKFAAFYLIRYVLLPILAFIALIPLPTFYSTGIVLLLLLPGAVSGPAFARLFNGNIDFTLTNTFITNIIAPFIIPFACLLFFRKSISIDSHKMFMTLFFTIILPLIIHFPLRKFKNFSQSIKNNNPFIAIVCISITLIFVIAKYKTDFIQNHAHLPLYILLSIFVYAVFYAFGWLISKGKSRNERITSLLNSGANNIGLGVTITILYFPADINIFFIVCQILWSFYLIPLKWIFIHNPFKFSLTK